MYSSTVIEVSEMRLPLFLLYDSGVLNCSSHCCCWCDVCVELVPAESTIAVRIRLRVIKFRARRLSMGPDGAWHLHQYALSNNLKSQESPRRIPCDKVRCADIMVVSGQLIVILVSTVSNAVVVGEDGGGAVAGDSDGDGDGVGDGGDAVTAPDGGDGGGALRSRRPMAKSLPMTASRP